MISVIENMQGRLALFDVPLSNLNKFRRYAPGDKDCVINALEILGILNPEAAGIARILVGDVGVGMARLAKVFSFVSTDETCYTFKAFPLEVPECLAEALGSGQSGTTAAPCRSCSAASAS